MVGRIFGGTLASLFSIDFLWTLGGGNICNLKEKHCQDCNQYNRVKNPQTLLHSHVVKGARIKIDRKLDPQRNLFSFQKLWEVFKNGKYSIKFPFRVKVVIIQLSTYRVKMGQKIWKRLKPGALKGQPTCWCTSVRHLLNFLS